MSVLKENEHLMEKLARVYILLKTLALQIDFYLLIYIMTQNWPDFRLLVYITVKQLSSAHIYQLCAVRTTTGVI